jgi:4-amino-4-deoxy-L-arabinose transferase-like glycosyltransferase
MTDAFPRTRRPLPWILAVFLGIVFLVPVDATTVNVHLPVNSDLDRLLVIVMVLLWFLLGGDQKSVWRSRRSKLFVGAVAVFWAVLIGGVLTGSARIIRLDEWTLAQKQFALIASFFVVGWFALTALRARDLQGFSTYLIGLGTLFAIGMLIERRTGYNVFYSVSRTILKPIATVGPTPTVLNGDLTSDGRVVVVGSTGHGLAAVAVLASVMGFALMRVFDAPSRKSWWLNGLAFALMAAAAMATQKKTALVVLLAVILFVGFHRRRKFLRLLPLGVVLLAFMHAVSPGNIGTVLNPALWFASSSTSHRTADLSAIWPDVVAHPLLGRGYGSVNVDQPDQFRILDDQYLSILWQTGLLGLTSYVWMIVAPIVGARRARRARDPTVARTAIAASAGCLAFLVVNALFDTFSYSQAPYMFFIMAAFCVVSSGPEARQESASRVAAMPARTAVAAA